jgi:hypothetical protein
MNASETAFCFFSRREVHGVGIVRKGIDLPSVNDARRDDALAGTWGENHSSNGARKRNNFVNDARNESVC